MITYKLKHSLFVFLWALVLLPCCKTNIDEPTNDSDNEPTDGTSLNWADTALWYDGKARFASVDATRPDVFYLLPTCVSLWTDEEGNQHGNADPTRADHLEAWRLSAELADTIFATRANLFLPYYRQATFGALEGEPSVEAYKIATADVLAAFDHYLKHFNNGRPFILAGYSQGGKMVTEVLKHMDDETYNRLIAAYVVGFGITASDTITQAGHHASHIRPAQDSIACGVTVNFNSVTTTGAICPLLCQDNIACINPVSWTTAATPALLLAVGQPAKSDDHRFPYGTAVVANDANTPVTVSVDPEHHVLIVDGIDPQRYFLEALQSLFPVGNLHLQELFFYGDHLRHNVLLRTNEMNSKY